MRLYMVERYLPGVTPDGFEEMRARIASAARVVRTVRYLGSTFVPEEESCFCRFEGTSLDAVRRTCEAAGVPFARIHQTCDFPSRPRRKQCAG
jgi:hypothetical protein